MIHYTYDERESRRLHLSRIAHNTLDGDLTTKSSREAFCARLSAMDIPLPEFGDTPEFADACERLYAIFRGDAYVPKDLTLRNAICERIARKAGYQSFAETSKDYFQDHVIKKLRNYKIDGTNISRIESTEELIDRHANIILGQLKSVLKLGAYSYTRSRAEWQTLAAGIDGILRANPNVAVPVATLARSLNVTSDEIRKCAKRTFIQPLDGKQGTQKYHAVDATGKRISHDSRYNMGKTHCAYVYVDKSSLTHDVEQVFAALNDSMSGRKWLSTVKIKAERFYAAKAALLEAGCITEQAGARGAKHYTKASGDIEQAKTLYVKPKYQRSSATPDRCKPDVAELRESDDKPKCDKYSMSKADKVKMSLVPTVVFVDKPRAKSPLAIPMPKGTNKYNGLKTTKLTLETLLIGLREGDE